MSKKQNQEQANELTAKKSEFVDWYNQLLLSAGIIDKRYEAKGTFVWLPYGYSVMNNIKAIWDKLFRENGIKEMYFPLLIPINYAKINESWFDGFKEQAFWVKTFDEKEPQYVLRPTGEPAMYPMFKLWTRSYSDLPIRIYETVSSFRYETKQTRPMIRDREITVWHEIHTAHETKEESEAEAELHQKLWDEIWEKLALPPIKVRKPQWECFPGAIGAIEYYSLMPTGKVMENGSINMLGQAYSKKFDIKFKDKNGKENYAWMVCTGVGARLLATVIAMHGDDKGLVLPPRIAPIKVVIVPIIFKGEQKEIIRKAEQIKKMLEEQNITTELDLRDDSPGSKFYDWELKGVPIRIEIGPRDMESNSVTMVRRDTLEKSKIKESQLKKIIPETLEDIQSSLLSKAKKYTSQKTRKITEKGEVKKAISEGCMLEAGWCGSDSCWDKIKNLDEGIELFGTKLKKEKTSCLICQKPCDSIGLIASTY